MGTSWLESICGLSAPTLPPPKEQCTFHFQLSLQKHIIILMSHCIIAKSCRERETESPSHWGTSGPHPQYLQLLLKAASTGYLPRGLRRRAELVRTLTGGTDPMWDTHSSSNGASRSRRSLRCRKGKSESGPWLLQPLPSPAPHKTAVTARSHPSGHDTAICRHPNSQTKTIP